MLLWFSFHPPETFSSRRFGWASGIYNWADMYLFCLITILPNYHPSSFTFTDTGKQILLLRHSVHLPKSISLRDRMSLLQHVATIRERRALDDWMAREKETKSISAKVHSSSSSLEWNQKTRHAHSLPFSEFVLSFPLPVAAILTITWGLFIL